MVAVRGRRISVVCQPSAPRANDDVVIADFWSLDQS